MKPDTILQSADAFLPPSVVRQTAGASAPASSFRRDGLTSPATVHAGGGRPPAAPAGSILVIIAACFAIVSAAFLSGPLPIPPDLLTDGQRIAMGFAWAGVSLAWCGGAILARLYDEYMPPRGVAVLKARARFQRISRNQIRNKRHRFMRGEFRALVSQLHEATSASLLPEMVG